MQQKPACIYCGVESPLSESDIIPDALTNARITNKNVCKTEHNNKFSDLFESEVIEAFALITNKLDVKSRKGKNYAAYPAIVGIDGVDYNVSMTSEKSIFDGRVIQSVDKKHKMSSLDRIKGIAKNPEEVEEIDVNNLILTEKVSINLEVYFSEAMYRMISKIAFEWYCVKNNVSGYHEEFANIISFITTGKGNNPVTLFQNKELYEFYEKQKDLGSHCLFGFEDQEGKINVVVVLFGVAMYRVVVADNKPEFCPNNFLYTELRTDSLRREIVHTTYEQAETEFFEALYNGENYIEGPKLCGISTKICLGKVKMDFVLYTFVFNMIKCLIGIHNETDKPNKCIIEILIHNIMSILQSSLLHKKTLKRFVKDYFPDKHESIKINPISTNKRTSFLFYILFSIGKQEMENIDDNGLQKLVKEIFHMNTENTIVLNDELEKQLIEEILSTPCYSEILEKGANVIKVWKD